MFGYEIGAAPEKLDGTSVLARIVDGLAFRYYWATDGLRPEDFEFRPGPDSMSTLELQKHMLHLVFMIQADGVQRGRARAVQEATIHRP